MTDFAGLEKVPLREIWANETRDFTPWLAANIGALGSALGKEFELVDKEAPVGDFSLDLLAKDLGTSQYVIIENQLTPTDHDHLGKLMTYAAGYNASTIIWVAESIREEHRQALEWLNQRTDGTTQFFGVVVEILRIDSSRPALNFKPVVFPNEWQKSNKSNPTGGISEKGEKYRQYFQNLIDKLRDEHSFTGARVGQPQNWYSFASGMSGVTYGANFSMGNKARTELYIDTGNFENNRMIFDTLQSNASDISTEFEGDISWERMEEKRGCRIAVYMDGAIENPADHLEVVMEWHIKNLLIFKHVFTERVKKALDSLK